MVGMGGERESVALRHGLSLLLDMGRLRSCVCLQEERGEALVTGEHGRSFLGAGRDCGWRVRKWWREEGLLRDTHSGRCL